MYHHLGPCHVRPSPNRLQTAWGHCGGAVAVCHNCQGAKNASGIYQATRVINLTKFDIHENLGKPIQRNPTNWGTFWLVGKIRGILSKSRQSRFVTICHAFSDKCYNFKRESFNCVTICHDFVFSIFPVKSHPVAPTTQFLPPFWRFNCSGYYIQVPHHGNAAWDTIEMPHHGNAAWKSLRTIRLKIIIVYLQWWRLR